MWEEPRVGGTPCGRNRVGGTPRSMGRSQCAWHLGCVSIPVGSGSALLPGVGRWGRSGGEAPVGPCGLNARHKASLERRPGSSTQELAVKSLSQVSFLLPPERPLSPKQTNAHRNVYTLQPNVENEMHFNTHCFYNFSRCVHTFLGTPYV